MFVHWLKKEDILLDSTVQLRDNIQKHLQNNSNLFLFFQQSWIVSQNGTPSTLKNKKPIQEAPIMCQVPERPCAAPAWHKGYSHCDVLCGGEVAAVVLEELWLKEK